MAWSRQGKSRLPLFFLSVSRYQQTQCARVSVSAVTPIFLGEFSGLSCFSGLVGRRRAFCWDWEDENKGNFYWWLEASKKNHLCRDLEPRGVFSNRQLKGCIHLGAQSPGQGRNLALSEGRWRWHSQGSALVSLLLW